MDSGLPPNWTVRLSRSRNIPYYFNESTQQSRWDPPDGTDGDQLKGYMAAHHSTSSIAYMPLEGQGESEGESIRASHILIKHKDSRRPSSWKENNITRSKEDAIKAALNHEARIRAGMVSLAEVAVSESDCPSARKGGDLGFFKRGEMQKPFEDAAFGLEVGQMSKVIETASGIHLIERTG